MSWKCINCTWTNADKWDKCAKCGMPKNMTDNDRKKMDEMKEKLKNFLVVTTENFDIEKTFGIVSYNLVIGTGMFSDFSAGLSDMFGTYSSGYQKKLDEVTSKAFENLLLKCTSLYPESNAVIATKIDYSVMSGNMVMINIYGTAVKLKQ